jgi:hypothetical protein
MPVSLMNINANIFNKILANQIHNISKRSYISLKGCKVVYNNQIDKCNIAYTKARTKIKCSS